MKEINDLIMSDYFRYYGKTSNIVSVYILGILAKNQRFSYSFYLRLLKKKNPFYFLAKIMHRRFTRKYGIYISPKTSIGAGFYISQSCGIVINETAVIGNNCNISQFTTIGAHHGKAAVIGDNVYIGPSVSIVENVIIGDNVTIGAGSVVVKDVPQNCTVAGVPSRVISNKNHEDYVSNKWGV